MPKRSSLESAYSRHWALTSHPVQIFFASRVEPPFSGKNASGSVSAHSACSCQDWASAYAHQPGDALTGQTEGVGARAHATQLMAGALAEPVRGPVVRTHVVAQPRHLSHDVVSPLALHPVRGRREGPGPLSTR
jgi:hypothetical protein